MITTEKAIVPKEFGQLDITGMLLSAANLEKVKMRLHLNYIPDITFDVDLKKKAGKTSIMNIIKPRMTIMYAGRAYSIDPWTKGKKIQSANPRIFDKPTALDSLLNSGAIPLIAIGVLGLAAYGVYRIIKKK